MLRGGQLLSNLDQLRLGFRVRTPIQCIQGWHTFTTLRRVDAYPGTVSPRAVLPSDASAVHWKACRRHLTEQTNQRPSLPCGSQAGMRHVHRQTVNCNVMVAGNQRAAET